MLVPHVAIISVYIPCGVVYLLSTLRPLSIYLSIYLVLAALRNEVEILPHWRNRFMAAISILCSAFRYEIASCTEIDFRIPVMQ